MEERARHLLPHVWHAFFGRFGRLTETQIRSIAPIVAGKSTLLCAPTASGKTEAIIGPLLERLIQEDLHAPGPRLLVICPTRALCNDLHRRIRRPIEACRWRCELKTGDSPEFDDADPPHVVVTTPESLDSLLSRRPAALRHVGAIFLDELHLLDGSPRGDQLRVLVSRLQSFRKDLQVCGASATAADSRRLASEFAGEEAQVITVEGERDRQLDLEYREAATLPEAAEAVREIMLASPGSKLLIFANSRAEVEWMAAELKDLRAFAHHGSLSRGERLRVESHFLRAPSGLCVATMTLELGVDIGDVDRVVLINPPPNVASFSQRVGRSNRRGGRIQATAIFSSTADKLRFEHMERCIEEGKLFVEAPPFRPSILAQQAVSLLFQNPKGWVNAKALHGRLPKDVQKIWSPSDCEDILKKMREEGYLHADSQGRYVADEEARRDHRYGRIHAHMTSTAEVEVVDATTGRTIGTAAWTAKEESDQVASGGLLLGGENRKITRIRDRQIFVETGKNAEEAQFLTRMGPRYSFGLARDLAYFLGHQERELRFEPREMGKWRLHHFFGTLWGQLLAAVLRAQGFTVKKVNAFHAECELRRHKLPLTLGTASQIEAQTQEWLQTSYKFLAGPLEAGPWNRFVPDEFTKRWILEAMRPQEFAEELASFVLYEG